MEDNKMPVPEVEGQERVEKRSGLKITLEGDSQECSEFIQKIVVFLRDSNINVHVNLDEIANFLRDELCT